MRNSQNAKNVLLSPRKLGFVPEMKNSEFDMGKCVKLLAMVKYHVSTSILTFAVLWDENFTKCQKIVSPAEKSMFYT